MKEWNLITGETSKECGHRNLLCNYCVLTFKIDKRGITYPRFCEKRICKLKENTKCMQE